MGRSDKLSIDAYRANRTATVGNSRNRSPYEMFYGKHSHTSPIPFKPGFCKYKRMHKMDPKVRECFYLSSSINHPCESKRVLVHSRKVIVTRNVTWAHVPSVRPVSVQPKPSMKGEHHDWLRDREESSIDGRVMEDEIESVVSSSSGHSSGGKQTPPQSTSGRVASPPHAGGLSAQSGVSLESLSNSSATSTANGNCGASSDCDVNGAGKYSAVLPAAESRCLADHIPGPQRPKMLEGRTRGEERRRLVVALFVQEEAILEDAFMVDREASVQLPSGNVKGLPPPPTTQAEVERSPFRRAFKYSQKVELNGLLGAGCFKVIDMKALPHGGKIVGSRWVHSYRSDELGNFVKTKSPMVATGFTQMPNIDYHETTSPTPAAAPVKIIAVAANELGLPVFHLDVSQAFVQAPLDEEIHMRLPPVAVNSLVKSLDFSNASMV